MMKMKKYLEWRQSVSLLVVVVSLFMLHFVLQSRFTRVPRVHGDYEPPEVSPEEAVSSRFILSLLAENGTKECHNVSTAAAYFFGLPNPENGKEITLSTDVVHRFSIVSYDASGHRRCFGGDFYETDLAGPSWKSRPPVRDLGNGSYLVDLKVDGAFAGTYLFKAILLFPNFHGIDSVPLNWTSMKEMFSLQIRFVSHNKKTPQLLPICTSSDFKSAMKWAGQWTRTKYNESCELDKEARYRCLQENEQCDSAWCTGPLGSLESNGWVYTAHCKFHIWSKQEAWQCLSGKKLFFWGDSNHQDTIRNLMNFVLGFNKDFVPRIFIANLTNPSNPEQMVRIASVFNGHANAEFNDQGLRALHVPEYRDFITTTFLQNGPPDVVILNSGLHDGKGSSNVWEFVNGTRTASSFWDTLLRPQHHSNNKLRIIFRTTVAPAGDLERGPLNPRTMPSNAHKMEAYNAILGTELRRVIGDLDLQFVDAYDMTFPWHFDYNCSDGGHYGRPPLGLTPWFGGRIGHYYYVDIMLVHALLTAICK